LKIKHHIEVNNFSIIQSKLEQFIKRYYINELLKGCILFFAIGLLYFLFTLFIEYMLWLNTTARTILFWMFIAVELLLFIKFIAFPLSKLFKLQKGIDQLQASKIIGNHFPQVNDKLLNILQLKQNSEQSELLLASIEQKSEELSPIPFKLAVDFKQNLPYLKYAAIPILILLISYVSGKFNWFSDSYERVVNYKTAYEPPAPFQFFVLNENLQAVEDKDFTVKVKTVGDLIPENVQIRFNNQTYFLRQLSSGEFEYVFSQPKNNLQFTLFANDVYSKPYSLSVLKVPKLKNFELHLDYPAYTQQSDEILQSTGSATIPEGTKVTWNVFTQFTDNVRIYTNDTTSFNRVEENLFSISKQLFNNYNYSISTSNSNIEDYENLAFNINVIKDAYPELDVNMKRDSLDSQTMYFYGQASDDYGLKKLQMVYYPSNRKDLAKRINIPISSSNFDEFVAIFPNQLQLDEGVNYELYFQLTDNDVVNNYKSVKSAVFSYRKLTESEVEDLQLQEQNETIKDLNESFEKLKEQDKQLEEFSKTQKEKDQLNFNDKKKLQNFLQRQRQQEEMMKNFNKKLQENLEELNHDKPEDQFKKDLQKRLQENEEQLKKDEKLLEELEKLQDKIKKEELTQRLEQLAKQNKNKKRSLEQLLELTKRFYVAKKNEKLQKDLEDLSKEQSNLSKEDKENNTKDKQEELNKKFENFQKEMEELKKENEQLKKPFDIPEDKPLEDAIKKDQQEATEQLEKQEQQEQNNQEGQEQSPNNHQQKAQQKQKNAAKKMQQMAEQMMHGMMASGAEQIQEDAEMLRQILDNLLLFSFEQEHLMEQFSQIDINHNKYGSLLIKQKQLREHFEHIDDSLFQLSLRQPKISEIVNTHITDVYFNIDKSMNQLSENELYQGVASQQYTITSTNELANFLSDILANMQAMMGASSGSGQSGSEGEMQLPDIIMNQEQIRKQMEQGMQQNKEGKPQNQGEGKEGSDGNSNQKSGEEGEQQGEGNESQNEEMFGEILKIYQQQQQLRQELEDKLRKSGNINQGKSLLDKMEEIELDLLNKGFTNQTLQKMMQLEHQLLKMENATFLQGQENRRESKTNQKNFDNPIHQTLPNVKDYFNSTEILNRQALPLQPVYKKKVQQYFKSSDDNI